MEGSSKVLLVMVIFVVSIAKQTLAKQYVVGGSQGWDQSTDFNSWASGQTFKVGDQLVFKYTPGLHSVVELGGESGYKSCDTTGSALNSLNGGNDVVKLTKPGTRYFACGTMGHCGQGMKLKITTVATDSSPSTSPSTTSTTSEASAFHSAMSTSASSMVALLVFGLFFVI